MIGDSPNSYQNRSSTINALPSTKQEANRVKAIKFTDVYGNEWERTFAFGNEKDSLTIREKQQ